MIALSNLRVMFEIITIDPLTRIRGFQKIQAEAENN
jgi:Ni,Fe-hydrogenase I large subunit